MFTQDNVWYADEKRAKSVTKQIVYNAKGTITYNEKTKTLKFSGNKTEVKINNIKTVEQGHQSINWVSYLLVTVVVLAYGYFTKQFIYMCILMVPSTIIGLLIGWYLVKWTVIEYEDHGTSAKVYFADGRSMGWSGIMGGNKKLFKLIKSNCTGHD